MRCRQLRRLTRILGRRGVILLSYATTWILIGYGQLISPQPDQRGLKIQLIIMPLEAWAWLWIAAGIAAVIAAFMRQGADWFGFVALVLVVTPWALAYLIAWWPLGVFPRGWIAAAIYSAIAAPLGVVLGWREPPRPKRAEPPYES